MSALDLKLVERLRQSARATQLAVAVSPVPDPPPIANCWYRVDTLSFDVVFVDGTRADLPAARVQGIVDPSSVMVCEVDEFRQGVVVLSVDGTTTSFSAAFVKWETDEAFRKASEWAHGDVRSRIARAAAMRVREARVAKGCTVAELSRRTGIAAPNLHRLEAGDHVPMASTLLKVAEALDVPLVSLLPDERPKKKRASSAETTQA
jgi:ribosome-binding protein aMBF1 (putative translation factor)